MRLDDLVVYRRAMDLGEEVWRIVEPWSRFERDTVGRQLIRAADSVAANISEGFGRYHFKENRQFCFYARGSLHETRTWLQKAGKRGLVSRSDTDQLRSEIDDLGVRLNNYIASIGRPPGSNRDRMARE